MEFLTDLIDSQSPIYKIFTAIFLGLIIGLKKEMNNQKNILDNNTLLETKNIQTRQKAYGILGLRTMPLIVLFGTISTFFGENILALSFLSMIIIISLAYYNGAFNLKRYGLTSEITALIMFIVGVLIGKSETITALVLTIVIAIINAYKNPFHNFAKRTTFKEWSGALQLIIISALVLPFLPKEPIDSFGVFVPFKVWLLVIFISAISFIGYFFKKYFSSSKSILATSIIGSLVSSTAVTISIAQESSKNKLQNNSTKDNIFLIALLLASVVMMLRVLFEVMILSGLLQESFLDIFINSNKGIILFLPSLLVILTLSITGFFLWFKKNEDEKTEKELPKITKNISSDNERSPFELIPALKFGIFFTFMLFIVFFSNKFFGSIGVYFSSFLASLVDVEASTLSALDLYKNNTINIFTISAVVMISLVSNTVVKVFYLHFFGDKILARKFLYLIIPAICIGLISFFIINFML